MASPVPRVGWSKLGPQKLPSAPGRSPAAHSGKSKTLGCTLWRAYADARRRTRSSRTTCASLAADSATLTSMAKKTTKKLTKKTGRRGGRKPGQWVHVTQEAVGKFRKGAQLSRGKLAEMLGVSSTSVQNWEAGHSVPMPRYQQKLAELITSGGAKPSPSASESAPTRVRSRQAVPLSAASPEVEVTRLSVAGEIMKDYLATPQGAKVSQEQLVALTRALMGALT